MYFKVSNINHENLVNLALDNLWGEFKGYTDFSGGPISPISTSTSANGSPVAGAASGNNRLSGGKSSSRFFFPEDLQQQQQQQLSRPQSNLNIPMEYMNNNTNYNNNNFSAHQSPVMQPPQTASSNRGSVGSYTPVGGFIQHHTGGDGAPAGLHPSNGRTLVQNGSNTFNNSNGVLLNGNNSNMNSPAQLPYQTISNSNYHPGNNNINNNTNNNNGSSLAPPRPPIVRTFSDINNDNNNNIGNSSNTKSGNNSAQKPVPLSSPSPNYNNSNNRSSYGLPSANNGYNNSNINSNNNIGRVSRQSSGRSVVSALSEA